MEQQIDLSKTTSIPNGDGTILFQEGYILQKISRFITGNVQDGLIPVPVFFHPVTKEILLETVPPDLKEHVEEYNKSIQKPPNVYFIEDDNGEIQAEIG